MPARATAVTVALVAFLAPSVAACGGSGGGGGPTPGGGDAAATVPGTLDALSPCTGPPVSSGDPASVPGLVLPPGAVVTEVTAEGPLTKITGYLPLVPARIKQYYDTAENLRTITSEDEVFEAEVLVTDGSHRTFVKARATCRQGSDFVALVAAETAQQ